MGSNRQIYLLDFQAIISHFPPQLIYTFSHV